jgi:hypothetical protein
MTDGAMFYPLFKILQEKEVYYPKINNADVYLDFIEKNYENHELENKYQDYTKLYDKKEFDWLYYYVYVILFIDFDTNIDRELYEKIIAVMIVIYKTYEKDETTNMRGFSYSNDGGIHIGWSDLRADDPKLKTSLGRL